ncbi:MAG: hypothetical protein ACXW2C_04940 [Acidimicrobiia bacterium]
MNLRSVVAAALVVVASVLAPFAVTAVWVHRTIYDTDGYVAAVSPLADDAAMQEAVSARTVDTIDRALDRISVPETGRVGQRLLDEAEAARRRAVVRVTTRFVESERFADLWTRLNRAGHNEAVAWFSGESTRVRTEVVDDQLVVGLQPLVAEVAQRIEGLGAGALPGDTLRGLDPEIVLVDGPLVSPVQTMLRTLDDLAIALPLLTAAALFGAAGAASDRRRALARLGLGLVISMTVALVALRIGRAEFVDWIATTSVSVPASSAFFDTVSRGLRGALLIGLVAGVGVALAARFAGGRGATVGGPADSVATFIAAHVSGASVAMVLVGLAVLALIPGPTLGLALGVGLVVLAAIVGLSIVARRAHASVPSTSAR